MTTLAAYSPTGPDLASFDSKLTLGQAEPLGVGVKRVTMEQLELGASGFFDGEDQFSTAVHDSRKTIKKVRSLLRLVKSELTDKVYRYEDKSLRNTARLTSEIRSSAAVVEAVLVVEDLYGEMLAEGMFEEMISRLTQRRDVIELRALEDPNLIGRVVRNMERAYHRYSAWPTDPDARKVYGLGIRDRYKSIQSGLEETYGVGRTEMVTAYTRPTVVNFHLWRKRAKYLRYQMEFLVPLWPEVVVGMAVTLDRLGLFLGEDHDLAELLTLIHERPDICPNPRERSLFSALVTQRRAELQLAAEILGRRIYAENPDSLSSRFGEYWESRQLALDLPLDTVVVY
ncbi:MAG: CHAD domain-containing protein [Acidimicrobiia bacterium]